MLELQHVSKHMGSFCLKDINIQLPQGYIMGLIGPNGSGKTTLLHLIMGLFKPEEGSVEVFGKDFIKEEAAIHNDMGVVLQERLFDDYITLQQNGAYYGSYYKNYDEAYFLDLLKQFELEPKRKYKGLSKGEELKFQFAFALAHKPKLLLLDEPTGNFDPEFREEFLKLIKEFIADGTKSVILATHLTDELDHIADYITYLENGEQLFSMDIEELRDSYRIVTADAYRIKLLPPEAVICVIEGEYATRALVRHRKRYTYDGITHIAPPTIEELMYFMTKRKKGVAPC